MNSTVGYRENNLIDSIFVDINSGSNYEQFTVMLSFKTYLKFKVAYETLFQSTFFWIKNISIENSWKWNKYHQKFSNFCSHFAAF